MEKIDVDALIERLGTGEPTANLYIVAALRQQQAENEELRATIAAQEATINEHRAGTCGLCNMLQRQDCAKERLDLRAKVERMGKRIKQAENFPHDGKYNSGWHDCIAYIKTARAKCDESD